MFFFTAVLFKLGLNFDMYRLTVVCRDKAALNGSLFAHFTRLYTFDSQISSDVGTFNCSTINFRLKTCIMAALTPISFTVYSPLTIQSTLSLMRAILRFMNEIYYGAAQL